MKPLHLRAYLFLMLMVTGGGTAVCQNDERVLVNTEYEFLSGFPALVDWVAHANDSQQNLYVGGNIVNDNDGVDLQIMKYNRLGDLLWEATWSDSTIVGDAYATAIAIGTNYEVYVSGAAYNGSTEVHDMVFLKYSSSGSLLWQRRIAGPGSHDNVPSDIAFHSSGLVYATGAISSDSTQTDLAALCLNASDGDLIWSESYDHAGYHDAGVALTLANEAVYITGGSGSSWTSWSILTLRYSETGTLISSFAENATGMGFSQPRAMDRDEEGNIIVAGYAINPGTGRDMKLLKMDDELNLLWAEEYDYHGLDEEILDVTTDVNNDIYFTGYVQKSGGGSYALTAKVSAGGASLWEAPQYSKYSQGQVRGARVVKGAGGQVISACVHSSTSHDFVRTYGYSGEGYLRWSRDLHYDEGHVEVHSLHGDPQGHYYLNGIAYTATGQPKYIAQKLATLSLPQHTVTDSLGQPLYMDHQAIVAFQPSLVSSAFVHDREKHYTSLEDLVPDSIVAQISTAYGEDVMRQITVEKIFKRLTPHDTISISRNGYEVRVPDFYSRVLLHLPVEFEVNDFLAACNGLWPDINYAEANAVGQLQGITNDTYNENQWSLYPAPDPDYANASINVEGAWAIVDALPEYETRVGVFDSPVYWPHEDFGGPEFEDSKVDGGFDFVTNNSIEDINFGPGVFSDHGTGVAGIIGALTNNDIGIAGISGGNGEGNEGGRLYSYGVTEASGYVVVTDLAEAVFMAASDFPAGTGGDAIEISNFSLVPSGIGISFTLEGSFRYMWNNECAMVAARGNTGTNDNNIYPAMFPDSWIMSVGGSGGDGSYYNSEFETTDHPNWLFPSWGNVDFIAPFISNIIVTTGVSYGSSYGEFCGVSDPDYVCFYGTSASAPHVTGVGALLHSLHRNEHGYHNGLGPEDYEELLKETAEDIGPSNGYFEYPDGPDDKNGHGRVNATAALERVLWPDGHVRHISLTGQFGPEGGDYSIIELFGNEAIVLNYAMYGLEAGSYVADQYLLELPFAFSLDEDQAIDKVWKRESASVGFRDVTSENPLATFDPIIDEWNGFELQYSLSGNTISGTIKTWTFEVILDNAPNLWIPAHPDDLRAEISLLVRQDESLNVRRSEPSEIKVFPNPSQGEVAIQAVEDLEELTVCDLSGKVLHRMQFQPGTQRLTLSLAGLPTGMYLSTIKSTTGNMVIKKIVKL